MPARHRWFELTGRSHPGPLPQACPQPTTAAARRSARCARPAPSALHCAGRPAHASRIRPCRRSPLGMSPGPLSQAGSQLPCRSGSATADAVALPGVGARLPLRSSHAPPRPPPAHSARCPGGRAQPRLVCGCRGHGCSRCSSAAASVGSGAIGGDVVGLGVSGGGARCIAGKPWALPTPAPVAGGSGAGGQSPPPAHRRVCFHRRGVKGSLRPAAGRPLTLLRQVIIAINSITSLHPFQHCLVLTWRDGCQRRPSAASGQRGLASGIGHRLSGRGRSVGVTHSAELFCEPETERQADRDPPRSVLAPTDTEPRVAPTYSEALRWLTVVFHLLDA